VYPIDVRQIEPVRPPGDDTARYRATDEEEEVGEAELAEIRSAIAPETEKVQEREVGQ